MKLTIPTTLFTAFVFAFAMTVPAQDSPQKEQATEETLEETAVTQAEAISADLNLAPEQTEKLAKINLDFYKKVKKLKDRKASDEEFLGIYQILDDSVKVIFTQEQFKNWKDPQKGKGNNNSDNGNGNNGNGNGNNGNNNGSNGNNGNNKNN